MGLGPIFCFWSRRLTQAWTGRSEQPVVKGSGGRAGRRDIEALIAPSCPRAVSSGASISGFHCTRVRIYIDREEVWSTTVPAVSCGYRPSRCEEPISGQYTLEVSSPGMDRILFRLEHYAESIGETVEIRLTQPFEGRRKLTGVLAGVEDEEIVVQVDEDEYLLPLEWIQRARIVPRFE